MENTAPTIISTSEPIAVAEADLDAEITGCWILVVPTSLCEHGATVCSDCRDSWSIDWTFTGRVRPATSVEVSGTQAEVEHGDRWSWAQVDGDGECRWTFSELR